MPALFITFEGPEGAGKTTQIARLHASLAARGRVVTRTREPGGDVVGERVRDLLLYAKDGAVGAEAELLLFAASRAQNVRTVVRPALARGEVVLCDRYTDSTLAYQGAGRGLPLDTLRAVNTFATGGLVPDKTFLLDLPVRDGLARRASEAGTENRMDRESVAFHERVRDGFLQVAKNEPSRVVVVDASRAPDVIAADLLAVILGLL